MLRSQKKLGEILLERGLIRQDELDAALAQQRRTKEFLGKILVKTGMIKERELLETLSAQFNIPFISVKDRYINWEFVKTFSASLIVDYGCFPLERDDWSVTIAITNPLDAWALAEAEKQAGGLRLKIVLVSSEEMAGLLQRYQQYMRGNIPGMFK
ncbi:MAG: hypothetical protein PHR11_05270 [Candidatus Omnitrophica bacterium]|nr:hypothetical protein [Candidatus Omnitrophota bacterium]